MDDQRICMSLWTEYSSSDPSSPSDKLLRYCGSLNWRSHQRILDQKKLSVLSAAMRRVVTSSPVSQGAETVYPSGLPGTATRGGLALKSGSTTMGPGGGMVPHLGMGAPVDFFIISSTSS